MTEQKSKKIIENELTVVMYRRMALALEAVKEGLEQFDGKIVNVTLQKKLAESLNVGYDRESGEYKSNEWLMTGIYYDKNNDYFGTKYTLDVRVKEVYAKVENQDHRNIYAIKSYRPHTNSEREVIKLAVVDKRLDYKATVENIDASINRLLEDAEKLTFSQDEVVENMQKFLELEKQLEELKGSMTYEMRDSINTMYGRNFSNIKIV